MEAKSPEGSATHQCYYSLLGIHRNASIAEIRGAYRKLALKWHPDRRGKESQAAAGEAKCRFQRIQEAYSVLADSGKRAIYDAGLFDPFDDDDQDFTDFMAEMLSMMKAGKPEKPDTLEDLQKIFHEMVNGMEVGRGPSDGRKKARVESPRSCGAFFSP
uniref:Chaperone protein DnaJ-like isoform X4 n=1 Tax=Cymbidium ensifolium TaxID=78740 RepID=A0A5B9MTS6_CYMEN|nr:chaperone protein DnaJ-like isoform X4 [Cymbidium ensifolium]